MLRTSILLLSLLLPLFVQPQGMPPRIDTILRYVMAENGSVTQSIHDEFWHEVNSLGTEEEIDLALKSVRAQLLTAQEYQQEIWRSAKISKSVSQVVKTQRLIELEHSMQAMFQQTLPYEEGSPEYNQALTAY